MEWGIEWWIAEIAFTPLFTTVTGSVMFLIWCVAEKYGKNAEYTKMLSFCLRLLTIFFLIPVIYLICIWMTENLFFWHGALVFHSPVMYRAGSIFLLIWISGMVIAAVTYLVLGVVVSYRYRKQLPAGEKEIAVFEEVCEELGIKKGRVRLGECYEAGIPMMKGLLFPEVLLPVRSYQVSELRTIFLHELTHYKRKDIGIRYLAILVTIIHWFNPLAWHFRMSLHRWGEYMCDLMVYERAGGARAYFSFISKMTDERNRMAGLFTAHIFEKKHELVRRVEKTVMYDKTKGKKRLRSAIIGSCVFMGMAVAGTAGITSAMAEGYTNIYFSTREMVEIPNVYEEPVIYTQDGYDEGVEVLEGEVVNLRSGMSTFSWTISNQTVKQSSLFYVAAGSSVWVSTPINPAGKTVKIGISSAAGKVDYINATSFGSATFPITTSGNYRVFVENKSGVSVSVNGGYGIN